MLEPGAIVGGKLRIEQIIGQGGMGVVAIVTHLDLDQLVAVKVVHDEIAKQAEVVERFLREARASAKLRSEHVCKVVDFGRLDSGAPFLVMELLEGHDLGSVIEHALLPVTLAADYVLQACIGIAEAHAAGFIHRDLKPKNLFVTHRLDDSPLIKVLDFGIAKAPSKADAQLTKTTTVIGSPGYMSPEQLRSARDVDARSDIWSLGVILYECVAGKLPFASDTLMELAVKIAMDPPDPLGPEVDARYAAIVMRCLEKSAERRYLNVGELASDLAEVIGPVATPMCDLVWKLLATPRTAQATAAALPSAMQTGAIATGNAATQETPSAHPHPPTVVAAPTPVLASGDSLATGTTAEARPQPTPEDEPRTESRPQSSLVRTSPTGVYATNSAGAAADAPPAAPKRGRLAAVLVGVPVCALAVSQLRSSPSPSRPPRGSAFPTSFANVSVLSESDRLATVPDAAVAEPADAAAAAPKDAAIAARVAVDSSVRPTDAAIAVTAVDAAVRVSIDAALVVADAASVVHSDAGAAADESTRSEMARARNAMEHEDYAGALAAAESVLRSAPGNYSAKMLATRAACRVGKTEVARAHAAALNPRDRRNALHECRHLPEGEDRDEP